MIRHVLFVKFKHDVVYADIESVQKLFFGVKNTIAGIISIEWGVNDSPEMKNAGYTHCVFMTFADEVARQRYLTHGDHDKLKTFFNPLLQDIIVLDYTVLS